jgi:hypothetical protein
MEQQINDMLDRLQVMRKEAFGKDEMLYKSLGKAMGGLMDARTALRQKVSNGS